MHMAAATIVELYEQHIRMLPAAQRLQLLALIAQELAAASTPTGEARSHSILELDGLGQEIWQGIDAQEYVNALRAEWDERNQ